MTEADSRTFGAEIALLAEVFGERLSPTRVRAYFEALLEFEIGEVQSAMREAIKQCEYKFPLPATLIRIAREQRRAVRLTLGPGPKALEEPALTPEEAKGFLRQLMDKMGTAFASWTSPAPSRSLAEITADKLHAEVQCLRAVPKDPEHEAKKRQALKAFRGLR